MKNVFFQSVLVIFILIDFGAVSAYQAHYGPSELTHYDKSKAYNGYTLFTPFGSQETFLMDMEGNLVHAWSLPDQFNVEKHAYLLENGNLLRAVKKGMDRRASYQPHYQEVDWEGNIINEVRDTRKGYCGHHDFLKVWNKKLKAYTLFIVSIKTITHEEAVAVGCDLNKRKNYRSEPDGVVEIDMDGNVIWEWNISDHLIQDVSPDLPNYGIIKDHPEKLDPNFGAGRRGDWIHTNSIDYNEILGHLVINNSVESEFYVVDHDATFFPGDPKKSIALAASDAGDFVYRWGNPAVYDAGRGLSCDDAECSEGDKQLFFTHDIQWIRQGLPGAGHFLIFDNGAHHLKNTHSSIYEINPYDGAMKDGMYVMQMKVGSDRRGVSNQIVWSYASKVPGNFYAKHISGCQRMPNGNTVICAGTWGQFFEVTPGGDVVWEYINPVTSSGALETINDKVDQGNSVFRIHRYGFDHPAFKDRELASKGKLTKIYKR
jgi:hypothetical protein